MKIQVMPRDMSAQYVRAIQWARKWGVVYGGLLVNDDHLTRDGVVAEILVGHETPLPVIDRAAREFSRKRDMVDAYATIIPEHVWADADPPRGE